MMTKVRADLLLLQRGLAESRAQAQRLIMAGQVRADGQVIPKPSTHVPTNVQLEVVQGPPYVSRGGEKLSAALREFEANPSGWICADVGASTGGFTDCLLQHGAEKVYAIDVGQGILHWKLRQDKRVVVMERTNARFLADLQEKVDLVTIDASFISLKILFPVVRNWFRANGGNLIALIKPQFEAGRREVARGEGVIRNPEIHRNVLLDVLTCAQEENYRIAGLIKSPLLGPKGNVEFLLWLSWPGPDINHPSIFINPLFPALPGENS